MSSRVEKTTTEAVPVSQGSSGSDSATTDEAATVKEQPRTLTSREVREAAVSEAHGAEQAGNGRVTQSRSGPAACQTGPLPHPWPAGSGVTAGSEFGVPVPR